MSRLDAEDVDRGRPAAADVEFLDTCVQCRACESACPSAVPYGRIFARTRARLRDRGWRSNLVTRVVLGAVTKPLFLDFVGRLAAVMSRLPRFVTPTSLRIARLPVRSGRRVRLESEDPDVWLFTGCVMNSWYRHVHRSTLNVIALADFRAATPRPRGMCCGALHLHSGSIERARDMARAVIGAMPGNSQILVNSAGCGAAMKEYGELLGTEQAQAFADRVRDVHEWLAPRMPDLVQRAVSLGHQVETSQRVILHEPCHLRHVQHVDKAMWEVVSHVAEPQSISDDALCCGAGGVYALTHPHLARRIRDRKRRAIDLVDAGRGLEVVTANPGCHMFLGGVVPRVEYSVDVVATSLGIGARRRTRKNSPRSNRRPMRFVTGDRT